MRCSHIFRLHIHLPKCHSGLQSQFFKLPYLTWSDDSKEPNRPFPCILLYVILLLDCTYVPWANVFPGHFSFCTAQKFIHFGGCHIPWQWHRWCAWKSLFHQLSGRCTWVFAGWLWCQTPDQRHHQPVLTVTDWQTGSFNQSIGAFGGGPRVHSRIINWKYSHRWQEISEIYWFIFAIAA